MAGLLDFIDMEVEGFGTEIVYGAIVGFSIIFLFSILLLTWKSTGRRPLDYELFLVEMHTLTNRRIVELLHVGANHRPPRDSYTGLLEHMRNRVRNRQSDDGQWLAVSDTNVVIQSPSTVTTSQAREIPSNQQHRLTLWEIEIPQDDIGRVPDATRDSQLAAAAAISVLGRSVRAIGERGEYRFTARDEVVDVTLPQLNVNFLMPNRRSGVVHLPAFRFPTSVLLSSTSVRSQSGRRNSAVSSTQTETTAMVAPQQSETEVSLSTEVREQVERTVEPMDTTENDTMIDVDEKEEKAEETEMMDVDSVTEVDSGISIRLKFLDDTQRQTRAEPTCTVAQFRSVNFPMAVSEGKVVRLIFQGQLLRDDSRTLESYGLQEGCVVHCHISNTPYAQPRNSSSAVTADPNIARTAANSGTAAPTATAPTGGDQNETVDRTDLWFARVILALLTSHVTSLPVQLWVWIQHVLGAFAVWIRPNPESTSRGSRMYRSVYETVIDPWIPREDPDPVGTAADAAARPQTSFCIGDYLMWIFGIQCALVWSFVYYFPQLCDRTAFGLLILLTLYFVFVVLRSYETSVPWRTQSRPRAQQQEVPSS